MDNPGRFPVWWGKGCFIPHSLPICLITGTYLKAYRCYSSSKKSASTTWTPSLCDWPSLWGWGWRRNSLWYTWTPVKISTSLTAGFSLVCAEDQMLLIICVYNYRKVSSRVQKGGGLRVPLNQNQSLLATTKFSDTETPLLMHKGSREIIDEFCL